MELHYHMNLEIIEKTKHIPIIISTAKDLNDDEKKSLQNIVEDITLNQKVIL